MGPQSSRTEKLMFQEMAASVKRNEEATKRIEIALYGDERGGIPGVIGVLKNHDKSIKKYENDRTKVLASSFTISGIIAFLIGLFKHSA